MKTKFGNAKLTESGHYQVKTRKEGNHNKYLHRLIYEDFYGFIPDGYDVHHKDGNPSNNCILNLQLVRSGTHMRIHKEGKTLLDEHKLKISNGMNKTTSNCFRVFKRERHDCKQGFTWVYGYYENGKRKYLSSVNLQTLKERVIAKGLLWHEFDTNDDIRECN